MRAVVLRGTGGIWTVRTADGSSIDVTLRGRVKVDGQNKLAVGDEVELEQEVRGSGWAIASIQPRRSQLARRSPGEGYGERVVAANLDQVIVVFAMVSPEPHVRMLDRFLVIAEANDIPARIVVNKVDLAPKQVAVDLFGDYARIGYPVHFTSRVSGEGLVELHDALQGKNSALTGPSGVGKSSLLNAMYPGLQLRVSAISESVNKGRHTTVGAHAHPLPDGGLVMDTPGLREIGLWGLAASSLDACFPEFAASLGECRFADCIHVAEPSCAVRDAVSDGRISAARYESYVKLLEEVRAAERLSGTG
ncbi:MAG: ribosome small subunit-dependent GTPase A [Gemmatimonadaceae bacterium]